MNIKKYLTSVLYASQYPIAIWDGIAFDRAVYSGGDWYGPIILLLILIGMEACAVVMWMDAQTAEIKKSV